MSEIIRTVNLSRHFGTGETRVRALENVNLVVDKGEFTAIIGPSGSGKSTLLHLIGGLDRPSSGKVELANTNIAEMSNRYLSDFRRDHIGFIFQAYNLIPVLTAEENIEYILLLQGTSRQERKRRVEEMLKITGLEGLGHRKPGELSGGQQQRVAVARAMASKPDIILADEPTANLDSKTGLELLNVMRTLNTEFEMTFIFSTHDEKIMKMATRLVSLVDGQIAGDERKAST